MFDGAPEYPPAMTPRPSWVAEVAGGSAPSAPGCFPGEGWPSAETVDYTIKLIVLICLLLALPWLVGKLFTDPAHASRHAASLAVGSAT